jgi:hypothetical protein
MNFLRCLALQGKKELDDSSRLDAVEIVCVTDMLLSLYPSWSGQGLISTPVKHNNNHGIFSVKEN